MIAAVAAGFAVATWKTARLAHGVLARPMHSAALTGFVETRDIRERTDRFVGHELVFPAVAAKSVIRKDGQPVKRPAVGPISETTMNAALRRMGFGHDDHVAHGFRTCFSTLANESKLFDADTIEAAIAHEIPGTRGDYLRGGAFSTTIKTVARSSI